VKQELPRVNSVLILNTGLLCCCQGLGGQSNQTNKTVTLFCDMVALQLQQADITRLAVDAIVDAANTTLLGHRAAGPELQA